MGLFFIADILGGNKIVLVGSLIQEQMTRGNNMALCRSTGCGTDDTDNSDDRIISEAYNVKELEGIG